MMKRLSLISIASTLAFTTLLHAGSMGEPDACCTGFMSLEGGYVWSTTGDYNLAVLGVTDAYSSTQTHDQYAARLAAGILSMMDDQFGITGEVGWGYYGKSTQYPRFYGPAITAPATLRTSQQLSGFDTLFGVSFIQQYYSLYFKAGAMFQNMVTDTQAVIAPFVGFPLIDTLTIKRNNAAVLPEIKVGAAWNFNENWALTGAYMLAIGGSPKTTAVFNPTTLTANLNINTENPTINAALIGIQYTV